MTVLVILLVVLVLTGVGIAAQRGLTGRRDRQLESAGNFRLSRKAADEDVTRFGEELSELHFETLTTTLDEPMRRDYQRALNLYEDSKERMRDATQGPDVTEVTRTLEDGRFAMACVLARRDGVDLPDRRPPCFFNPAHGPAQADVEWAPTAGVPREIPVCFRCRERLRAGERPDVRTVRWGNRRVPWFQGGPAYAAYARGYYGDYAREGVFPAFILWTMLEGAPAATPEHQVGDWGGWDGGSGTWDDGFGTYDWGGWHGTGIDGGGGYGDGGGGGDAGSGGGGD